MQSAALPIYRTIKNSGFTLVELSIVLAILGLLTGGIMTGQSLIKAAELRSIVSEYQQWQTSITSFTEKYLELPGDMHNATQFWGSANGASCNTPSTGSGTGTETCNGNGDGYITSPFSPTGDQYTEMFTFWQQLSNAGMIQGTYTGKAGPGFGDHSIPNQNVPASQFSGAGWAIIDELLVGAGTTNYISTTFGSSGSNFTNHPWPLVFGKPHLTYEVMGSALTPEEAWNIDTKIDDGAPSSSNVVANGNCVDLTVTPNIYRLTDTTVRCILFFR